MVGGRTPSVQCLTSPVQGAYRHQQVKEVQGSPEARLSYEAQGFAQLCACSPS